MTTPSRLSTLLALLMLSCGGEEEWRGTVSYPNGPVRCICWGPTIAVVNECLASACDAGRGTR